MWLQLKTILPALTFNFSCQLTAGIRYKKGYFYHRLNSAQIPAGAETSWHDGQCPSLQPVLGHQHSFLLTQEITVLDALNPSIGFHTQLEF
jgi:hypothetical protein